MVGCWGGGERAWEASVARKGVVLEGTSRASFFSSFVKNEIDLEEVDELEEVEEVEEVE